MVGLLLASCGREKRQAATTGGARVIELWQGFNTEETQLFKEIMKDFEKEYSAKSGQKITVEVRYVSFGDMFTKLRTAALADITPDIAFMDAIKVTDLSFGKALTAIDEMPEFKQRYGTVEKAREEFVAASFNAGVVNRLGETHLYGFPVQTTTVALFWNREMFRNRANELRAAGLDPNRAPRDWDEVYAYGKVLSDPQNNIYGFGLHGSLWFLFTIFNMYDTEFVEYAANGRASSALDTPNTRAALARIQGIAHSGIEGGAWKRSGTNPDIGFLNRKYAMILTGPWNVENFTRAGLDFDIALIPAPPMAEAEKLKLTPKNQDPKGWGTYSSSNVGGQTGVILRTSQNKDIAYAILEYFTSEPVQRRWASSLGQIPVRKAAWKNLDTTRFPFMPKFMEQLAQAKRIPQIPLYGILESDVFNPQIDLLLQKSQTPDDMVKRMNATMEEKIFRKMNRGLAE